MPYEPFSHKCVSYVAFEITQEFCKQGILVYSSSDFIAAYKRVIHIIFVSFLHKNIPYSI